MSSFSTALTTVRRSPYQAIVAVLITSLISFIAYSVSIMTIGAQSLLNYVQTQPQVIAFFELQTPAETIEKLENTFRQESYVKEVTIITQEEALEIYREENQDDPLLLELVTADILPASIEIKAQDLDHLNIIKQDLEKEASIEEVVYQQETIDQLKSITESLRIGGLIMLAVLGIAAFLITTVIIAIKATNQKSKIDIMRLLGASKGFVKSPFVVEGMVYVFIGSLIGWIIMFTLLMSVWPNISGQIERFFPTSLLPPILAWQFLIGNGLALLLGALAGFVAISRLIKK